MGTELGIKQLTPSRRGLLGLHALPLRLFRPARLLDSTVTGVGCALVSLLPLGPIPELLNLGSLGPLEVWDGKELAGRGGSLAGALG